MSCSKDECLEDFFANNVFDNGVNGYLKLATIASKTIDRDYQNVEWSINITNLLGIKQFIKFKDIIGCIKGNLLNKDKINKITVKIKSEILKEALLSETHRKNIENIILNKIDDKYKALETEAT